MARPEGFEPTTLGLEVLRRTQQGTTIPDNGAPILSHGAPRPSLFPPCDRIIEWRMIYYPVRYVDDISLWVRPFFHVPSVGYARD
jgi:hypothetical protein